MAIYGMQPTPVLVLENLHGMEEPSGLQFVRSQKESDTTEQITTYDINIMPAGRKGSFVVTYLSIDWFKNSHTMCK